MKVYLDGVLLGRGSDFAFSDFRWHTPVDPDEEPHQ